jgi:hypothetical protein
MARFRLVQAISGVTALRPVSLFYAIDCFSLGAWLRCECLYALDASQAATFIVRRTAL